jgi:hypothetical protein
MNRIVRSVRFSALSVVASFPSVNAQTTALAIALCDDQFGRPANDVSLNKLGKDSPHFID